MLKSLMLRLVGFRRMRAVFILGLLGSLAAALGGCNTNITDKDLDKNAISVGEVRRLMDVASRKNRDDIVLLVDPRPDAEFAKGHLPGARNIQLSAVKPKAAIDKSIDRYKNIVVYGQDPASASARAMAKRLMGNGYDNVCYYAGGVYQWTATGGQLVTSEPKQAQVGGAAVGGQ